MIDTENRMKEIAGNLKRDINDLMGESANIVTGFFKQGWCTVRGVADKWKAFAQELSGAVENLMKPTFLEGGADAPAPTLAPEGQPLVTVMESAEKDLPVGRRMTLSEANEKIQALNDLMWDSNEQPKPVTIAIDYMMDGQTDRYWFPLQIGSGQSLLDQMQQHVDSCLKHPEGIPHLLENADPALQAVLHEQFGPQLHADLEKLSTRVIGLFRQHVNISKLEQQFDAQAGVMPEKKQEAFRQGMSTTIVSLRRVANTGEEQAKSIQRAPVANNVRKSVKVQLRKLSDGKSHVPKIHTRPER